MPVIATRMANALFKQARVSALAQEVMGKAGAAKPTQAVLEQFSAHYGGLWVGGRATLTDAGFVFEPNLLNRIVHADGATLRMELALDEIRSVATRFGWFTGIIDIGTDTGSFSIRCYGSKGFAAEIARAAGLPLGAN